MSCKPGKMTMRRFARKQRPKIAEDVAKRLETLRKRRREEAREAKSC